MTGNLEHIDLLSAQHYLNEIGQQLTEADKVRLALTLPMSANRRKLVSKAKPIHPAAATTQFQQKTELKQSGAPLQNSEILKEVGNEEKKLIKAVDTGEKDREAQLEAELNKQIASSAISSFIADEVDKIVPQRNIDDPKVKKAEPLQGVGKSEPEVHLKAGQKSFTSWLKDLSNEGEEQSSPSTQNKRKAFDVIDDFISSNPQIVKNTSKEATSFFKASEHAKQSILESDALYTETYANILEGQGNLKKALEVLENLMLKFPEKSTYFARRIKAVEKQLNS